jgi:ABC-2 type transport system ATP-binding protein
VAIMERGRIVDIDSPAGLVARHCPERIVELSAADEGAGERFRTIPSVDEVMRRDAQFVIRGHGPDLITDVIHCLSEHRIRVTAFRTVVPTLEDVFLKITGHSIRA